MDKTIRLDHSEIEPVLEAALLKHGFSSDRASLCASLFTETSLDGVYSHGLNRFPLFLQMVEKGIVRAGDELTKLTHTIAHRVGRYLDYINKLETGEVFTLQTLPDCQSDSPCSGSVGEVAGFSLHAGVATKANVHMQQYPCLK